VQPENGTMTRTEERLPDAAGRTKARLGPRNLPWLVLALGTPVAIGLWLVGPPAINTPVVRLPIVNSERATFHENHFLGAKQLAESNAATRREFADLAADAHDGRRLDWQSLSGGQPVLLVFIKDGCPCNAEFDSYLGRVEKLYRGDVRFAGVIDGDVDTARRYVEQSRVEYPILADPDRRLIRRFNARNGCYAALLAADGALDTLWPGYSADALRDLARRIAALTHVAERLPKVSDVPAALTTGCPFTE
jgi:peroxiredoxin